MTATFDYEKCIKCGKCYDLCPLDVISIKKDRTPYTNYPDECQLCFICHVECPEDAIRVKVPLAFW
jgi:NAD-dependent dihydropyrimidine dehydrogenase PreA subunit